MSCDILEQSVLAGTDQFLDLGAAKHKDNARSITEYKTSDWIYSRKLGKGRGRVGDSRQPQRNSRQKPNASKFLPLFLKPQNQAKQKTVFAPLFRWKMKAMVVVR